MFVFGIKPNQIVLASIGTSLFLLATLAYVFHSGNQLTTRYTPQLNAVMEIKLNGALAHLWLEEIMSGDDSTAIDEVWAYLSKSDNYALTMLSGGEYQDQVIKPLAHNEVMYSIQNIRDDLAKFRAVAERRFINFESSKPGSEIDQQYDWLFEDFIKSADQAESMLRHHQSNAMSDYRRLGTILLLLSFVTAVFLTAYLYRMNRLREKYVIEIEDANQEIEDKNRSLDYLAHFDKLTGLPNRVLLIDRLKQSLIHAERSHENVVLLFLDLDRFKNANDRLGHHSGDVLLTMVAERLKNTLRSEDTVARLGGDEFTIILSGFKSEQQAISVTNSIAKSIIDVIGQPYTVHSNEAHVTASIGVAVYPKDGKTADGLLMNADIAMYHAKATGKNGFQYHSQELKEQSQERLELEIDLRRAIKNNEFYLDYQTQWNLSTGQLYGVEALLRWKHPEKGVIQPDDFIACCEDCGMMDRIEDHVFDTAMKQYAEWKASGIEPGRLALNISLVHFQNRDLVESLVHTLTRYNLKPEILELELTESVLMQDTHVTHEKLQQLKNLGIHLAIDDFGTGYSSMSYLLNFPIDTLKIDRSFIKKMDTDESAAPIISNIIFLADSLNLEVVAEGVETEEQAKFLNDKGCQYGQGFLLGKPMNIDKINNVLLQQASNRVCLLDSSKHLNVVRH